MMNRELRFFKHSKRWDGSVLFLGNPGNYKHYAVRYLIEDDQFIDILKQENNINPHTTIDLSMKELENNITKKVFNDSWYSNLLYLDEYDGYKAYTFTCDETMFLEESFKPSDRYLKVILNGMKEFNSVDIRTIIETFLQIPGVNGFYSYNDLIKLID